MVRLGLGGCQRATAWAAGVAAALWLTPATARAEGAGSDEKLPVKLEGRLFLRETLASLDGGDWFGEASLASARVQVTWTRDWAEAQLELEARDGAAELRDAWMQLAAGDVVELRFGRQKLPVSALEMEGAFDLPVADRGMLSGLLDESFAVTGRRVGGLVRWRHGGVRVRGGLFQSVGGPALLEDVVGLDAVGRGAYAFERVAGAAKLDLQLGASGIVRLMPDAAGEPRRYWLASLDFTLERRWRTMAVRLWVEGFAGTSPFDTTPATPAAPLLVAGRALVAWRYAGQRAGDAYLELFALTSVLDPNLGNADDVAHELSLGVNLGAWKRWRAQLELQLWRESSLTPPTLHTGDTDLTDRNALLIQVGTVLRN